VEADGRDKARLKISDTKLGRIITESRKVEGSINNGKNYKEL
jgi:hypothetical protein